MLEDKDPVSYGKYDIFISDDRELQREMLLAQPMTVICSRCKWSWHGPAGKAQARFRDHATRRHKVAFPVKKKVKEPIERSPMAHPESVRRGLEASRSASTKWTRDTLLGWRDAFLLEHGRLPTSNTPGAPHTTRNVNKVFGSWAAYMEAQ